MRAEGHDTKKSRRDMILGTVWCVAGLAVTYLSYWFAESGGSYVVATGAIVWGAAQGIGGLVSYVRELSESGERRKMGISIACGILALCLVAGLAFGGYRFVHRYDLHPVSSEQVVTDSTYKFRFTVPPGYEAVESDIEDGHSYYWAIGETSLLSVECMTDSAMFGRSDGEIFSHLKELAENFYANYTFRMDTLVLGNNFVYKYVGRSPMLEECRMNMYDMVYDGAVVTFYYNYEGTVDDDPEHDRAADSIVASVEFF